MLSVIVRASNNKEQFLRNKKAAWITGGFICENIFYFDVSDFKPGSAAGAKGAVTGALVPLLIWF